MCCSTNKCPYVGTLMVNILNHPHLFFLLQMNNSENPHIFNVYLQTNYNLLFQSFECFSGKTCRWQGSYHLYLVYCLTELHESKCLLNGLGPYFVRGSISLYPMFHSAICGQYQKGGTFKGKRKLNNSNCYILNLNS